MTSKGYIRGSGSQGPDVGREREALGFIFQKAKYYWLTICVKRLDSPRDHMFAKYFNTRVKSVNHLDELRTFDFGVR